MITEQEKEFAIFELQIFKLLNITPAELEEFKIFTLFCWLNELKKQKIDEEQKRIFEEMVNKNRRTRN